MTARHGAGGPAGRGSRSGGLLPMAAAAATGVQVGAAIVATRFVVDQTGPATLALLRYAIGVLCLLPFVLASARTGGRVRFARRDLLPIAILGIGQFGILVALLNFGLRTVPSGRAALLFATFPLMTMLLAAALGREALSRDKTLGVLATLAGVALVLGGRALESSGALEAGGVGGEWIGTLAVLASALCGAVCSVFYRPYLERYPALPTGAFAMLASVGFLALLAAGEGSLGTVAEIDRGGWLAVCFIGLSSAVGYVLWLWALGRASPTRVTVFLALGPPTAALLGALLLHEPLPARLLAGLALVALGLWLAHREGRRRAR